MINGAILDLDGVLWRGSDPIPGSVEAVNTMRDAGLKILYLSNNSTMTREMFHDRLSEMGYPLAPVISSAIAASRYLLQTKGRSRCLVLGERGLIEELRRDGHDVHPCGGNSDEKADATSSNSAKLSFPIQDIDVDAVVAGLDRNLTYAKLADAMHHIRKGALFVATNEDPTLPWKEGGAIPGAGTIICALRTCTGVEPVIVGKPHEFSTSMAIAELGLEPSEILMIGDRMDTDIASGSKCGTHVALVLTGDAEHPGDVDTPVYPNLLELVRTYPFR